MADELDRSGWFEPTIVRRYAWDQPYTTRTYVDVLLTYSNHLALPSEAREGLLACIARLIDTRHGGAITKRYLNMLHVARRKTSA